MEDFLGKRWVPGWYNCMDMNIIQAITMALFMIIWLCVLIGGLPDVRDELDRLQDESEPEDVPETSETCSVKQT